MTVAAVATAIQAAIAAVIAANAQALPATAATVAAVTTLTANHKGTAGNGIDVRINAYATDVLPAGLVLSIVGFSGGALIPTILTTVGGIAGIMDADDSGYLYAPNKYMALGLSDSVTLSVFDAESQRRYMPPIQSGFRSFAAFSGSFTAAIALGAAANYPHISTTALNSGLTTPWETAAIIAAVAGPSLYNNPVRSMEGLPLLGLQAGAPWTWAQQNSLLFGGLSIVQKGRDGTASIKRLISMYQFRPDGSLDDAFLDINTTEVDERIRYEQRMGAIQRFVGKAAAKSDEDYRPGLPIVTIDTVRAYLLTLYKDTLLAQYGWVQNYVYYKANLIVEQDPNNPSRFNFFDTPVILSPFYILAGRSQFRKAV